MITKEAGITRRDVEAKLANVGDYVKMDYLQACLKKNLDFDTKKYVLVTLAGVYESRKMHLEAGKMLKASAEINATFEGKMNDFMKAMDLFIRGGSVDEAEVSFAKALACADGIQKERLKNRRKESYRKQAEEYISKDKRKHAMELYQKYISIPDLNADEKRDAQNTLLGLYEKLGKITEYASLKRAIANPLQTQTQVKAEPKETKGNSFSFRELGLDD